MYKSHWNMNKTFFILMTFIHYFQWLLYIIFQWLLYITLWNMNVIEIWSVVPKVVWFARGVARPEKENKFKNNNDNHIVQKVLRCLTVVLWCVRERGGERERERECVCVCVRMYVCTLHIYHTHTQTHTHTLYVIYLYIHTITLPPFLPPLSLSLSLTHTHTHTSAGARARPQERFLSYGPLAPSEPHGTFFYFILHRKLSFFHVERYLRAPSPPLIHEAQILKRYSLKWTISQKSTLYSDLIQ